MISRTLYESILVLLISVSLAAAVYVFRPQVLPLFPRPEQPQKEAAEQMLFQEITIEQARQLHAQQSALFADARSFQAYAQGHIQGAVHLDPHEFDQWSQQVITQYAPDKIIVTYCDGPRCPLAEQLAEKLTWLGFEKVYHLKDGWGQWQALAGPTAAQP